METYDLLLEIGCEEIPSRLVVPAIEQLKGASTSMLEEQRLGYSNIDAWGTPRRLVLLVSRLESRQPDLQEKIKGPPCSRAYDSEGRPTEALLGFFRSQGIGPDQVAVETIRGADYVTALKETAGRRTVEILPEMLPRLLRRISFPRPMYWREKEFRFARPVRWLLSLYGIDTVVFDYAGVTAGRKTYGHRFLSPGPFTVESPARYFELLNENYVLVNQNRRREMIRRQLEESARECGGNVLIDEELLDEVTFLVEHPVAITGSFDPGYLDLPREVLVTTMQSHQRYFAVAAGDGRTLLPHFIGISNNRFHENIQKGYEKVLQARLADARFFFDEDRKRPLEDYVPMLEAVVYHETLGSLEQKRRRLVGLVETLGERLELPAARVKNAARAAHLCKADLVTHMVREFPELQGVIGREYALLSGEPAEMAAAIYEHYLPRHAGDKPPATVEGALVSLADRIDTLAGCFAAGIQPTGSQDPYGLRRQAQGIVSVILSAGFELAPAGLIEEAIRGFSAILDLSLEQRRELPGLLEEFITQRIRFAFQEKGLSYDVVEAVLAPPLVTLPELFQRASFLEDNLKSAMLEEVITAYNRVASLARSAPGGPVDPGLFDDDAETSLYRVVEEVTPRFSESLQSRDYDGCCRLLQSTRESIDRFFDRVMVMVDDRQIRDNRLNLLLLVRDLFMQMANFGMIQAAE